MIEKAKKTAIGTLWSVLTGLLTAVIQAGFVEYVLPHLRAYLTR